MDHRAQARHVEIRRRRIAAKRPQDALQQLLGMRMIDELRLEPREDRDVLVHRKVVLGVARIERSERRLGELARKRAQRDRVRPRRIDEQLPVV